MNKNCMQCVNRELAINMKSKRGYSRCKFDHELHVNKRMSCDEWTGSVVQTVCEGSPYFKKLEDNGTK